MKAGHILHHVLIRDSIYGKLILIHESDNFVGRRYLILQQGRQITIPSISCYYPNFELVEDIMVHSYGGKV